jgi:hypothetical protein
MPLSSLPQSVAVLFLTDGGLETTLVFQHGLDLPDTLPGISNGTSTSLSRSALGSSLIHRRGERTQTGRSVVGTTSLG